MYVFQYDLVVNCTPSFPFAIAVEKQKQRRVPIEDDPFDSVPLFQIMRDSSLLDEIHELVGMQKKVLVHCLAGVQRSPAVVACYLIKFHKMTPNEAIEYIKSKRHIAFFWQVNLMKALERFYEHIQSMEIMI
jgi:protein-tyrosine phosphatase